MTETATLMRLMAWFSPAYPTGGFSYSHGIEYAVEAGLVRDRASLVDWVAWILRAGAGRIDAMLFRSVFDAADDLDRVEELAELAAAFRSTAETALESAQQGAAFLATTRQAWPSPRLDTFAARWDGRPVALPVAAALACVEEAPQPLALAAYLHAMSANLISAAVRLIPLGQSDGQRAVAALAPVVEEVVAATLDAPRDEIGSAAFMVDWTSLRHETQYTRLFRS